MISKLFKIHLLVLFVFLYQFSCIAEDELGGSEGGIPIPIHDDLKIKYDPSGEFPFSSNSCLR